MQSLPVVMRRLALLLALLPVAALGGCPTGPGCTSPVLEQRLTFSMTGRLAALHLFRASYYSVQRLTLPELGVVPDETGGGLRRLVLTLDATERLAVVLEPMSVCTATWSYDLDCRGFVRSELDGAAPGDSLPSGGVLVGVVAGHAQVTLRAPLPSGRLTLVRLDPPTGAAPLTIAATARFEFNQPLGECLQLAYSFPAARCGNGLVEANEQCDDENTDGGDGCSVYCSSETPWCRADGVQWLAGCDGAEPSRCESRACAPDDPDPRCAAHASLDAATFVRGRFAPGADVAGRVRSAPAGLDCSCGHAVLGPDAGRACDPGCAADLPACSTAITPAPGVDAPFAGWDARCWGDGACHAPGLDASTVVATFATPAAGLELARPLVQSGPGGVAPMPAAAAVTADGGLLVALPFSRPFVLADQELAADGPAAVLARLDADGATAWLARLSVRPGEELALHALAAAPDGGAVLVGSFRGRLDAGGLDVQSPTASTRELFVAGFDADGTARFATHVELAATYWTSQAAVAVDAATIAVAATVTPSGWTTPDLGLVALGRDGAIARTRLVLDSAQLGSAASRGVALLPGGDWLVAGAHAAAGDAAGLLPPRDGTAWLHFVARLGPDLAPVWATPLGTTTDSSRPSAFAADPGGAAWYALPLEPVGRRLLRVDAAGDVALSVLVTDEGGWEAPLLAADPATGDALVAGNGATWVAQLGRWETWLARIGPDGSLRYTERQSGGGAASLRYEALAVAPGGGPLFLASYKTSVAVAGTTLFGCDGAYSPCTSLALLGGAP